MRITGLSIASLAFSLALILEICPSPAAARPVPTETIRWSAATAQRYAAEIGANIDVRDVLSRLSPDQQRNVRITAAAKNIGHSSERELFVRIVHNELCEHSLCPMILMQGRANGNLTMIATEATRVRLLSVWSGGYKAFRVYRLGTSYVDFYCGSDARCSTPS
ncbi:hypothetical protein [Bradyrhizobium daqingense]|uniref:hypothetical protein n=1 Tax=Bradyrhizobium daqingense TaxID=993502 RepID=UPI0038370CE8